MITMATEKGEETLVDVVVSGEDFEPFVERWCGPYATEMAEDIEKFLVDGQPFEHKAPGVYRCKVDYEEGQRGPEGQVELASGFYLDPYAITFIKPLPPIGEPEIELLPEDDGGPF